MKGYSFIRCSRLKYSGDYVRGLWPDRNDLLPRVAKDVHEALVDDDECDVHTGWGIKFDIVYGHVVRPVAKQIKRLFSKKKIKDIAFEDYNEVFGEEVGPRVKKVFDSENGHSGKYSVYNPWYGVFTKVARSGGEDKKSFFLAITTPWKSFYIGKKTYECDPLNNDYSWANEEDVERAKQYMIDNKLEGSPYCLYLCWSATMRSHR
jgi:hypothetical protein